MENYGKIWEVDHIIPCAAFDLSNSFEQRRCFNWRNLQPLLSKDNMKKGQRYVFDIKKELELYFAIKDKA